ncbi:ABC-2 transporter permease [Alicyclobacillus sp. SO9]|uniref:ABC-2 transporter permease n=1 Tax=Alicyclobacillus sp. SO9 TaxID=2665646 RepID=UPI0018E7DFCB|nr:ABC-2 transporter permease [Alicyclobacillus sp. SO9]QQE77403.1 ABC-2 transporter permease [Alicyclobacillus sp. SO9]
MESYFPKALWFKEWREHRWRAVLAAVIISLSPVARGLLYWSRHTAVPGAQNYAGRMFWNQFNSEISTFSKSSTTGLPAVVVVVIIAIILVVGERNSGSLWYILSTPVQRRQWLRTKFLFGLGVIYGTYTILLIWNSVVTVFNPAPVGFGDVVRWWIYMLAVQGTVYAVAFVTALCVTNAILVFIGTFVVLGIPSFLSGYIHEATIASSQPVHVAVQRSTQWIDSLSPLAMFKHNLLLSNPFLYLYMVMIPLLYVLAQVLMRRIEAEHLSSLLTLPKLWYLVIVGISTGLGSIFATVEMALLSRAFGHSFYPLFVPLSVLSAGVIGLLLFGVIGFRTRRRRKHRMA